MDCERAANLTSARADREPIAPTDAAALDAHLAACPACREAESALRVQDAQLLRAFAPHRESARRVADRVTRRIAAEQRSSTMAGWTRTLFTAGLAAAAGFVLAALLFRPWERQDVPVAVNPSTNPSPAVIVAPPVEPARPTLATLSLATGLVEVKPAGAADAWRPLSTGAAIAPGDVVRTGPKVRCEFVTPEGSQVRLNNATELRFRSGRLLDLNEGQLWSTVAKAEDPFRVQLAGATVTALGTQFDVQRSGAESVLTVVEGATRVETTSGTGATVVRSGHRLTLSGGRPTGEPEPVRDLLVATRWVHEILLMKGRGNDELARRIDDLFAQIGHDKMAFMHEQEIRALGDHCVVPLARYLQSDRSRGEDEKRRTAARILADVAQPWSAGELIDLLEDRDGEVRYHAAAALARLTGQTMDRTPEQWRNQAGPHAGRAALDEWRQWWAENKERFPGAP